jgi:hypothetical protein
VSYDAERLDAALNRVTIGASLEDLEPALRTLVDLGAEVGRACGSTTLSAGDRQRIYAAALDRAGTLGGALRLWRRLTRRQAAALIGGATVTALAAAVGIGVAVGRGRRGRRVRFAAASG